jgi:hypothetical protein
VPIGTGDFCFFILTLKGDADMTPLPKLQKILLWAGVALIVAALISAPRYWEYCEMRALKAEFDRFVDVENWPAEMEIRAGNPWKTIEKEDFERVKAAIGKLEFGGKHTEKAFYESVLTPTGAKGEISFVVLKQSKEDPRAWHICVNEDGVYCYDPGHGFAMKNSAVLYRVLESLNMPNPS